MADLGGVAFTRFSRYSHTWDTDMNLNLTKMAALLQPSVVSRTSALPGSAADNECYIDPATSRLNMWLNGEWNQITLKPGVLVYIQDAQEYASFNSDLNAWQTAFPLNVSPPATPRTLAFYAPGKLRPSAPCFVYVAGQEFTLAAGAPGSSATLEVAPSAELVLTFGVGSITFAAGSTAGIFTLASDLVLQAVQDETEDTMPSTLTISVPSDALGAEGLAITLRGTIRPPNEG